ncbi:ATP-binding cassette domain-containing protein [Pseudoroseomonas wenyumeiae]
MLDFMRGALKSGVSCVLISHMMGEILNYSDLIAVMKNGQLVASGPVGQFSSESLVELMSGGEHPDRTARQRAARVRAETAISVRAEEPGRGLPFIARQGEVIGLAGLSGHGQTDFLVRVFEAARARHPGLSVSGDVSFVAGDRQADGVFPLWSIADNIGVASLPALRNGLLLSPGKEKDLSDRWGRTMGIKAPSLKDEILSLSGGNQQKALFARALSTRSAVVLMDDPMRGVDINTKLDVYDIIAKEATGGRTFLWYTTEFEEPRILRPRLCLPERPHRR